MSHQFFNQWETKPISPFTHNFPRALNKLRVIARNSNRFNTMSAPVVIGRKIFLLVLVFPFEIRSSNVKQQFIHEIFSLMLTSNILCEIPASVLNCSPAKKGLFSWNQPPSRPSVERHDHWSTREWKPARRITEFYDILLTTIAQLVFFFFFKGKQKIFKTKVKVECSFMFLTLPVLLSFLRPHKALWGVQPWSLWGIY